MTNPLQLPNPRHAPTLFSTFSSANMAIAPITGMLRKRFWVDISSSLGLGVAVGYAYWYVHKSFCIAFRTLISFPQVWRSPKRLLVCFMFISFADLLVPQWNARRLTTSNLRNRKKQHHREWGWLGCIVTGVSKLNTFRVYSLVVV
jgi:hypothetical protein